MYVKYRVLFGLACLPLIFLLAQYVYGRVYYGPAALLGQNEVTSVMIKDGDLLNADINSSAGIVVSKLALNEGYIIVGNSSNVGSSLYVATSGAILIGNGTTTVLQSISGDATLSSAGVLSVSDLTIASEAQGDILIRGASGWTRLAAGTSGYYLQTNGAGANPSWVATTAFTSKMRACKTTGTQEMQTGGYSRTTFDTEDWDGLNEHATSSGYFTANATGTYNVSSWINYTMGSAGGTIRFVLKKAGMTTSTSIVMAGEVSGNYSLVLTDTIQLNAGQSMETGLVNWTGQSITVQSTQAETCWSVYRIF